MASFLKVIENKKRTDFLSVGTADCLSDILTLEQDWRDLETRIDGSMSLFQNFDWCQQWCLDWFYNSGHLQGDEKPFIVTVWQGGQLALVWPLQCGTTSGVKTLSWLGSPALQYGDVLIDPDCNLDQVCQLAWDYIAKSECADLLRFDNVPSTSPVFDFLSNQCTTSGDSKSSVLEIGKFSDWQAYQATLKKTARRARRKRYNKLSRAGDLTFTVHQNADKFKPLLDVVIDWKCKWLERQNWPSNLMGDPKFKTFMRNTIDTGSQSSAQWVAGELALDGKPIAIEIGAIYGDRYISYMGAYNENFAKSSPGKIELEEMIHWAYDKGLSYFDFLCVSAQYKSDWTDTSIPVKSFTYAHNVRGKLLHSVWLKRLRPALKFGLQHTPQSQRKLLAFMLKKNTKTIQANQI